MRIFSIFLATIAVLTTISVAIAQNAEICNAALASGIRDNYYILTEREQFELYQKRLCDAKFDSYQSFQQNASGLKLDLPTAEGLIGLSGTADNKNGQFKESYSRYCSSTYFDSQYRERFTSYSSRVSAALTESWLECHKVHTATWLAANQKGIYIAVTPQENFSDFTVTVTRRTADGTPMKISDLTPAGSYSCVYQGKPFGSGISVKNFEFAFTCTKPQHKALSISLDTSQGVSNTVHVPGYTSKIVELNDRLTRENKTLTDSLRTLENRVSKIGTSRGDEQINGPNAGGGNKTWTATSACPDGYFVAGVTGQDQDGGDPCYNCMTNFNVICRPIVSNK